MTRLEAEAPALTGACDRGVRFADWPSGVSLMFENGAFVGWAREPVGLGTGCVEDS